MPVGLVLCGVEKHVLFVRVGTLDSGCRHNPETYALGSACVEITCVPQRSIGTMGVDRPYVGMAKTATGPDKYFIDLRPVRGDWAFVHGALLTVPLHIDS
ncbi:hypothetical protein AS031_18280 [Pseudarthrobacter enclensis]|uniref:Uncharacterized protein n=1 Tax=Pseudarthrobacter enclensis TaxID=993070 RepID=A0A0V8I5D9_9MICC|nr:hypothetical protein AS031_18280 [Pseudarthrobacter enclensis]